MLEVANLILVVGEEATAHDVRQRYTCPKCRANATHNETSDQNRVNQGLLYQIVTVQLQSAPVAPPLIGPRVSDHGPLVLAL